jgi:hypothetical protein
MSERDFQERGSGPLYVCVLNPAMGFSLVKKEGISGGWDERWQEEG